MVSYIISALVGMAIGCVIVYFVIRHLCDPKKFDLN